MRARTTINLITYALLAVAVGFAFALPSSLLPHASAAAPPNGTTLRHMSAPPNPAGSAPRSNEPSSIQMGK